MTRCGAVHHFTQLCGFGRERNRSSRQGRRADASSLRIPGKELDDLALRNGLHKDDVVGLAIGVGLEGIGNGAAKRPGGIDRFSLRGGSG